jgi:choline dehydrogenase
MGVKKHSKADGRDADLYMFALPGYFKGYHPGWAANALQADHISWVVLKGHTQNTAGSVTLNSDDPTATPNIDFRYFTDGNDSSGDDLDAVVEGVRHVRRINRYSNFRRHVDSEAFPSKSVKTEKDVREFVQREAFGHHASCSNKMGNSHDPMAVVDGNFRVHGVKNLRVVDASVFPKIPGLFIVVPTYMISEKASEIILRGSNA